MRRTQSLLPILLAISLLAGSLGACQKAAPTAEPTSARAQMSTPAPTSSPVPTSTSAMTAEPSPALPPEVVQHTPARGEEQGLDAPILLTFDQPMDQASVEQAFHIEPTLPGTFRWSDQWNVAFLPAGEGLVRGQVYEVILNTNAKSDSGVALQEITQFAFSTVGFLEVAQTQPATDTRDVGLESEIVVTFNRPVVPLTSLGQLAELPQPLTLTPPVRGRGEWLNTAIYRFVPEERLSPATTYKARIAAGLTDTTGGELAEDYLWSFTTLSPAVLLTVPDDGSLYVGPSQPITVTFNQPVDRNAAENAFTLVNGATQDTVPGVFAWPETATMTFLPDRPLARATRYQAMVSAGVSSDVGQGATESNYGWSFTTAPPVAIERTSPHDGEQRAEPWGRMEVTFAGPMDIRTLESNLTVIPEPTSVYTYWRDGGRSLDLNFTAKPSTNYTVTFGGGLADRYGQRLVDPVVVRYRTRELDPMVHIEGMDRVGFYNAYTHTVVYVSHRNVARLDLSLYRLNHSEFIELSDPQSWETWQNYRPDQSSLKHRWSMPAQEELNQIAYVYSNVTEDAGELAPGLYYLELSAPEVGQPARQLLVVSKTNLTLKAGQSEALLWATDLSTGEVVPMLDAVVYEGSRELASGSTGEDGVLHATFPERVPWDPLFAFVGLGRERFGVSVNHWSTGISPWEFDIPVQLEREPYQAAFYTDRPIYRPGQTVNWKGIIRSDDDAHYSLPTAVDRLVVRISDPQGKDVSEETVTLNQNATLHGAFLLDDEASTGYYSIRSEIDGRNYGASFQVAEYRKPEFEISLQTDKEEYVQGDSINVTAQAVYFFGGPVGNADVRWALLSTDWRFSWHCAGSKPCPPYDFSDYDWTEQRSGPYYGEFGELISEGSGRTSPEGRFTFRVPANMDERTMSQQFTLEVTVTDVNNQSTSSRKGCVVHTGEYYIGLAPQEYVGAVGQAQVVDVVTVSTQGEPIPQQDLEVTVFEHRWYSVQRKGDGDLFHWEWEVEDIPVVTTTLSTGSEGKGSVRYTPHSGGTFRILATGRDVRGNEVRASAYQWVSDEKFISWRMENHDRIELITDKKTYEPGDVAEVLIPSPYQGPVNALITIERGHILEHEVRVLQTNSDILRIPVTADHVPNVFVSVVLASGMDQPNPAPSFKVGYVMLSVSPEQQELSVEVIPERGAYRPGETVSYAINTKNHAGEGVSAELSLALVDKAVLALGSSTQDSLLDVFYGERGVGIQTSASLTLFVERIAEKLADEAKGGGGGGDMMGLTVRSLFPDTALWEPALTTDPEGRARISVDLPDSLTTWRLEVKGVTPDTLVGEAESDVVSTKELFLRPVLPRFFVGGDQVQVGVVAHNNTDHQLTVSFDLRATGLVYNGTKQTAMLPSRGKAEMVWPVTVQGQDETVVLFTATGGDLSDAVELTLPVYNYSTPELVGTAGQLSEPGERLEVIRLPERMDRSQGELRVDIQPSLASSTRDGLKYLEHYPYECVEQTVSRWLPSLLVYSALQELGLERPDLARRLRELVPAGLQRIYAQQHPDGGWGWWITDRSDPFLSGYVLLGMIEAQRAEFAVDREAMDRASGFLHQSLRAPRDVENPWEYNAQAFVMYVLAERGDLAPSRAVTLFDVRDRLASYGKAFLALTLDLTQPQDRTRVDALLSDLASEAILSATGAHWEETDNEFWTMNTDTRSTAVIVAALSRLHPDDMLLASAVRWLMTARRNGHWSTTQETVWALIGMTDYMVATGELEADYSWQVLLDNRVLGQGDADATSLDTGWELRVAMADLMDAQDDGRSGGHRLLVQRGRPTSEQTGLGQMYYTTHLRYFLPVEDVQATSRGVFVARQYSRLDKPGAVIDGASINDTVQVKITLVAPHDLHYLVVEDPLPAGCEGIDRSLRTTSVVGERPSLQRMQGQDDWGWWWFSHTDLRDEKAVLFATYLPRGTYEYTYEIRASLPGRFLVMPTTAYEMYFPEVWGRSDGGVFTVSE
jgi:uncharacterized protein YfaS (alpha-2-macroglobulin family)